LLPTQSRNSGENLTKRQAEKLATLLTPRTEGLQTAEAYQMKLSFLEEFWSGSMEFS